MTITILIDDAKSQAVCCDALQEISKCRSTRYYGENQSETAGSAVEYPDQNMKLCGSHLKLLVSCRRVFLPSDYVHTEECSAFGLCMKSLLPNIYIQFHSNRTQSCEPDEGGM